MTTATKPTMRPEAMEAFRYRRKLLSNLRTRRYTEAARQIRETGRIKGSTKRRLRHTESQIRAYNEIAEEYDLPPIR
jgi:hypothetical protein